MPASARSAPPTLRHRRRPTPRLHASSSLGTSDRRPHGWACARQKTQLRSHARRPLFDLADISPQACRTIQPKPINAHHRDGPQTVLTVVPKPAEPAQRYSAERGPSSGRPLFSGYYRGQSRPRPPRLLDRDGQDQKCQRSKPASNLTPPVLPTMGSKISSPEPSDPRQPESPVPCMNRLCAFQSECLKRQCSPQDRAAS